MAGSGHLSPRPQLLLLIGLPGAGKSTLARALAPHLGAVIVDRDAIRAALFPGRPVDAQVTAAANAHMEAALRHHLRAGRCVIADGRSLASATQRLRLARLARACGARCREIWLDVPLPVAIARVEVTRSVHPASDRDAALVRAIAARFEVPHAALRLDATSAVESLVATVLGTLCEDHSGSSSPLE